MTNPLEELVGDLEAEQAALEAVLVAMPAAAWGLPTHAPGWLVRDQVAHLATFDEAAEFAIRDPEAFAAGARSTNDDASSFEAAYLARGRALPAPKLLAWWQEASSSLVAAARTVDPKARLPWYGPPMSGVSFITARLMECWSHGLDVVDVVDLPRPDSARLRHVAFIGVRARPFSYDINGKQMPAVPIFVQLSGPTGETWTFGEEDGADRVTGSATDFCRVVTQRRHIADTRLVVEGEAAREWMGIAQAFAGPPGRGRQPGEFPREGSS
ncbi:MAG: TIGR03084 family metal-binding protein [Tepidiformaceae bacterium]